MNRHVAIIGGGIAGLASAQKLARQGCRVTLLEASPDLGGLGTFFQWRGRFVDRFYHCIMPSDAHLLALIREVGLEDQLYWKPTRMGFIHARRQSSLSKQMPGPAGAMQPGFVLGWTWKAGLVEDVRATPL